jgi:hypothetical protein
VSGPGGSALVGVVGRSMGSVLEVAPLGATDDFFGAGGDSHRAMQVLSALVARYGPADVAESERLHEELVLAMFDDGTPQALAVVLGRY